MRSFFRSIAVLLFLFSISACFENDSGNSKAAESHPSVVIAFKESELKDVIWVTPAILTKNYESVDDFDDLLQVMIFDGDELIIKLPEASSGQYKFKWELGKRGQILLTDLDPDSGPEYRYEIWKTRDHNGEIKITNDFITPGKEISFLKPKLLNANSLTSKSITMDDDREIGYFEGSQYKFNIYKNDAKNFYGDVSNDRFQNTVLVKTDHSADRYMLFEGLKPDLGILLKFSYWRINAEQPPEELGAIYRIKNLMLEDYKYDFLKSSNLNERYYGAHVYK